MKKILTTLGIVDDLTMSLRMTKPEFVEKLAAMTENGRMSLFYTLFEGYFSSKKEFKGYVDFDGFKIRQRKKLFDSHFSVAIATGTMTEKNGKLIVEMEFHGFANCWAFLLTFYVGVFLIIIRNFDLPLLLFQTTFVTIATYLVIRGSIKTISNKLEREFLNFTKNNHQF